MSKHFFCRTIHRWWCDKALTLATYRGIQRLHSLRIYDTTNDLGISAEYYVQTQSCILYYCRSCTLRSILSRLVPIQPRQWFATSRIAWWCICICTCSHNYLSFYLFPNYSSSFENALKIINNGIDCRLIKSIVHCYCSGLNRRTAPCPAHSPDKTDCFSKKSLACHIQPDIHASKACR